MKLFILTSLAAGSQELRNSCEDIYGGECLNWDNVFCTAGWETGLCPGANNIKVYLKCRTYYNDVK